MTAPAPAATVAILGTGIMGGAMARSAVRAGLAVRAWSRPLADAERLAPDGAVPCPTPRRAVDAADVVVTMAPDAVAIRGFATGEDGFLPAMRTGAVWVQSTTVGVAGARELMELARQHDIAFVDAPVLGTREPAERGELVVLASGDDDALARCEPLFDAVARRVVRLGPAGAGSRLKMVTNGWIVSCVAAIAEAIALARSLGVKPEAFLDAIAGSGIDMGNAQVKGRMMIEQRYPPSMPLAHALKDARLAIEAADGGGLAARVTRAAAEVLSAAVVPGASGEDMAAAYRGALQGGPASAQAGSAP